MTDRVTIVVAGLAPPFDPEAVAYFARAGITDETTQVAVNDWIVGVKSGIGLTLLSDAFDQIVMQANQTSGAAIVDWTDNELDQTLINSPTFTQYRGIANAGSTDGIDSNFNPVAVAGNFTLNSHSFGVYFRSGGTNSMGSINGGFAGFQIWLEAGGDTFLARDSTSSAEITPSNGGNKTGLLTVSRTASNAWGFYQDASSVATATTGPGALLNQNFYIVGRNFNGTYGAPSATTQAAFSFFGRGFTAGEMVIISAHTDALGTALGWEL